jgi:hypothetical protein
VKRLEEIKARLEAGSPRPWAVMDVNDPGEGVNFIDVLSETDGLETVCRMPNPADYSKREGLQADAALIASAPADLDLLVTAVEAVLAIHQPNEKCDPGCCDTTLCGTCIQDWPCDTVQALTARLDVSMPEGRTHQG